LRAGECFPQQLLDQRSPQRSQQGLGVLRLGQRQARPAGGRAATKRRRPGIMQVMPSLPIGCRSKWTALAILVVFVLATAAGCRTTSAAPGRVPAAAPAATSGGSSAPSGGSRPSAAPGAAAIPGSPPVSAPPPGPASPAPPVSRTGPASPALAAAGPPHPLRASAQALGSTLTVEVRDLPEEAANAAIQAAVAEVREVERLTDPDRPDGELAALNAAAGKGARRIDPRLFVVLSRALDFCEWSDGKEGPLGRDLHRLWGQDAGASLESTPPAAQLDRAVAAAACKHLTLDGGKQIAALDAGSALDLADFSAGMAVDRAIVVLRQHGSANAFVQLHGASRGLGPGRDGRGWEIDLPAFGGLSQPLGRIFLRDQSFAIAARDDRPLNVAGQPLARFIDQTSGRPAGEGTFAVLAVTALATDAQALAATMFLAGADQGGLLTGSIRPRPSILWLEGTGTGPPLLVDYRWTEVAKR
jgi:thiamine biosynthesis lipoprotein